MAWMVARPDAVMVEMACALYNATSAAELPAPVGPWGIDDRVWKELIDLTKANCETLGIRVPAGNDLKGMCIWASVVAAKFYVHRFAYIDSRVFRVRYKGDHYFVVVRGSRVPTGICDITCNQFGGPNYIAGTLKDVKGPAQKVAAGGSNLYEAYSLAASSEAFVM